MTAVFLVRYGTVPEVARFTASDDVRPARGERVVVRTGRGWQLGQVLERFDKAAPPADEVGGWEIVRVATPDDESRAEELQRRCESEFYAWCGRILTWNLALELIDLERTLDDEALILYVLAERGPATTQLALQAAADGLGLIEVQPVSSQGLVTPPAGGGCGSGGCGCHS